MTPPAVIAPGPALLLFALLLLLAAGIAWPGHGLGARLRRARRDARRIGIEDTLKYLFHRESEGLAVHPDAIAGALGIRPTAARDLLDRLSAAGLVATAGATHALTARGRQEALRVVRTHRLLEQYLADRTGVEPEEWHALAEEAEHDLTPEEAEALASRLGQPRFDPHGEPIPTADGTLPVTTIRPDGPPPERTLADATPGETVRVRRLTGACRGPQRRRLLDLGVVPGTTITAELSSPGGDPVAYRIRGALIALRRHQAAWIEIDGPGRAA